MVQGPMRTCVGCRRRRPQAELIRVGRVSDGTVSVGPLPTQAGRAGSRSRGRTGGRGAYICVDESCVQLAIATGRLARALRREGGLALGVIEALREMVRARGERGSDG